MADPVAAAFLRSDASVRQNVLGRTSRTVTAETTDDHRLTRLTVRWVPDDSGNFRRLIVERALGRGPVCAAPGNRSHDHQQPPGGRRHPQLAVCRHRCVQHPRCRGRADGRAFLGQHRLRRSLRKGDRFSVVYETKEADGEPLSSGRVLSAEFVNGGKTHQALWFQEPGATKGSYYTLEGETCAAPT